MFGMTGYSVYVPVHRLSRDAVSAATHTKTIAGSRSVANFDEDSLTMGIEAALECLRNCKSKEPLKKLLLASASYPYVEKQSANIVAKVCGLREDLFTADIANTVRAGTAALSLALSGQEAAMVVAADCRQTEQGEALEQLVGDAACAFTVGSQEPIATLVKSLSVAGEFTDIWKRDRDGHLQQGEDSFVFEYGYVNHMSAAMKKALGAWGVNPRELKKVAVSGPHPKFNRALRQASGLDEKLFVGDLAERIGYTGNAHPMMLLIEALESSNPGDLLLLGCYGDGVCDLLLFKTTDEIKTVAGRNTLAKATAGGREIDYLHYLKIRGHLKQDSQDSFISLPMNWREESQNLQLQGSRCQNCRTLYYPQRRLCKKCGALDHMDPVALSREGSLYTFTRDHAFPSPEGFTSMGVVDLDDGARFYGQVIDTDRTPPRIGQRVKLVFRKMHEGGGLKNYFWKVKP